MRTLIVVATLVGTLAAHAQPPARQLTLVEQIRIDGEREDFLFPFGFVHVTRAGTIAFANFTAFRIHYYDDGGKHIGNFGGKGGGPGEFMAVNWRGGQRADFDGGMVGDTLWTYDGQTRRITFISDKRRLIRSVRAPVLPSVSASKLPAGVRLQGATPIGVLTDGSILARTSDVSQSSSGSSGNSRPVFIVLIAPDAASYRVVAAVPQRAGKKIGVVDPRTGRTFSYSIPFTPRVADAVSPDGTRFVIVTGQQTSPNEGRFTITIIGARGDTIATATYPLNGRPLKPSRVDGWFNAVERDMQAKMPDGRPAFDPKFTKEVIAKLRKAAPAVELSIGQVRVGIDHSIWISLPHGESDNAWYIFDKKAQPLGFVVHKPRSGHMLQTASRNTMWVMEYAGEDATPQIVRYGVR